MRLLRLSYKLVKLRNSDCFFVLDSHSIKQSHAIPWSLWSLELLLTHVSAENLLLHPTGKLPLLVSSRLCFPWLTMHKLWALCCVTASMVEDCRSLFVHGLGRGRSFILWDIQLTYFSSLNSKEFHHSHPAASWPPKKWLSMGRRFV